MSTVQATAQPLGSSALNEFAAAPERVAQQSGASPAMSASLAGWVLGTLFFLTLAILLPLTVAMQSSVRNVHVGLAVQSVVVLYAAFNLAKQVVTGREHLFETFFWIYAYTWLGLAAWAQVLNDQVPTPSGFTDGVTLKASVVILIGMFAFSAGTWWAERSTGTSFLTNALERRDFTWNRVYFAVGLSFMIAPVVISLLGGPAAFFSSREALDETFFGIGGEGLAVSYLYRAVLTVPPLVMLIAVIHMRRQKHVTRASSVTIGALIAGLGILNAIVNNPISSPRYWAGTVAGSVLLVMRPWRRPNVLRASVIGLVLMLVVLFPYADYFRYERGRSTKGFTTITSQMTGKLDYDSFPQVQSAVDYVEQRGHTKGRQGLGPIAFFVPRVIWPDKPGDTGALLANFEGWIYTNLSAPLWAETFLDGGWLAVVLVFFLLGLFERRIDRRYALSRRGDPGLLQVFVPIFAVYQVIVLRGSLLPAAGRFVVLIAIALFASKRITQSKT